MSQIEQAAADVVQSSRQLFQRPSKARYRRYIDARERLAELLDQLRASSDDTSSNRSASSSCVACGVGTVASSAERDSAVAPA